MKRRTARVHYLRPTTTETTRAVAAWQASKAANRWPCAIDTLLIATHQGQEVVWPQFEGEAFSIIRVADSTEVEEEELPSGIAADLDWSVHDFRPALRWVG